MKLKLLIIIMDLLSLIAIPLVFLLGKLRQLVIGSNLNHRHKTAVRGVRSVTARTAIGNGTPRHTKDPI